MGGLTRARFAARVDPAIEEIRTDVPREPRAAPETMTKVGIRATLASNSSSGPTRRDHRRPTSAPWIQARYRQAGSEEPTTWEVHEPSGRPATDKEAMLQDRPRRPRSGRSPMLLGLPRQPCQPRLNRDRIASEVTHPAKHQACEQVFDHARVHRDFVREWIVSGSFSTTQVEVPLEQHAQYGCVADGIRDIQITEPPTLNPRISTASAGDLPARQFDLRAKRRDAELQPDDTSEGPGRLPNTGRLARPPEDQRIFTHHGHAQQIARRPEGRRCADQLDHVPWFDSSCEEVRGRGSQRPWLARDEAPVLGRGQGLMPGANQQKVGRGAEQDILVRCEDFVDCRHDDGFPRDFRCVAGASTAQDRRPGSGLRRCESQCGSDMAPSAGSSSSIRSAATAAAQS